MRITTIALLGALLLGLPLAGCRPSGSEGLGMPHATPAQPEVPGAVTPEAALERTLAQLRSNALQEFARTALPPSLHAEVEASWHAGVSRWPLTALPLDSALPSLFKALSQPNAEKRLNQRFRSQLAGQDAALHDAARTLGLFGQQYLQRESGFPPAQRRHYSAVIATLSKWGQKAPLGDKELGRQTIEALVSASKRSAIKDDADLSRLGMDASLEALIPLYIAGKQAFARYGLPLDTVLAGARVRTLNTEGDQATLELKYRLNEQDIVAELQARRVDGRWYLASHIDDARASLQPKDPHRSEEAASAAAAITERATAGKAASPAQP